MSLPHAPSARAALDRARHEARALHHEFLGTEHLLLGLLHEPGAELTFVLSRLQLAAGAIRTELDSRLTPATAEQLPRELPSTPRLVRALHFAEQEALAFEQPALGAEHLLLGLLREDESLAAEALAALGVTLAAARGAVGLGCGREYRGSPVRTEPAPLPPAPPPPVPAPADTPFALPREKVARLGERYGDRLAELERGLWEQQVFLGAALGAAAAAAAGVTFDPVSQRLLLWALAGLFVGAGVSALARAVAGVGVWALVGLALGASLSADPVFSTGGGLLGLLVGAFVGVNLTRWRRPSGEAGA